MQTVSKMYLITGSYGQLGTELGRLLPDAILTDYDTLDITDAAAVRRFVAEHGVTHIINCAAYTAVDKAEDDAEKALLLNAAGPANLAATGATVVHVSTDYVFDGKGHRPYEPTDEPNPVSVYGHTKLKGEQEVLRLAKSAIIIRTAWLYSAHGNNFVKTMRRLGAERESLNVVNDQIGTPTFAGDLAASIAAILPQIQSAQKGVYHYTNEGVASWYDFAREIMELSGLPCRVNPVPSSAYPTKAQRPFYSVLSKESIKHDFNLTIPHWKESLITCLKQF